ncbi:MAG: hypothetical protein RJA07_1053 [Bacteroidota bacterium]
MEPLTKAKLDKAMKNIYIIGLIVSLLFVIIVFSFPKERTIKVDAIVSNRTFNALIDSTNKKVVDLSVSLDLLDIYEFKRIYARPQKYLLDAKVFLSDSLKSEQQKEIVIYSMKSLDKQLYINFLSYCADLYKSHQISEKVIMLALHDNYEFNNLIELNFYSPKVSISLNKIKSVGNIKVNELVDKILSGRLWYEEWIDQLYIN